MRRDDLTVDLVLSAYRQGVFPMAHPEEDDAIYWHRPEMRAILPLEQFHISRSLRTTIRRRPYTVTSNLSFDRVIRACADRAETWISKELIDLYFTLHRKGFGHSIEVWSGDSLAGGLYGVAIGGAFFGESMFHRLPDAGNIALAAVANHIRQRGFTLFDIQFTTPHLVRFGAIEIPRAVFERKLEAALTLEASW